MSFLVAAVVFVGLLSAVNLLLLLAVVRRLREHANVLRAVVSPPAFTPPGTRLPDFTATDTTGAAVSRATFEAAGGTTVVGMFSTDCSACDEHLPEFAERVRHLGRGRVLALVVGGGPKAETFTTALAALATVVTEERDGRLYTAFGRPPFPGFYLVDGAGAVTASAHSTDELPIPASV
ncbi:redoxin domain-containing protein [Nonomuraea sp. PA05]|uniref:TlpA family protein disulfide reductase n=1 Tax=Nonomuraea sp. PA05 TaxID=2604466 RepID=UPI0011DBE3F0|nr:redoxin domain-containing protein [Nonomuraea sp. PA05]TYB53467.1 redoxin domain-containing protein [Nonomuraea sp. PA05]